MRASRRHLLVLGLLAALAACGGSSPGGPGPTPTPTPIPTPDPVVSYAGTWTGTYHVTTCTDTEFFAVNAFCTGVLGNTPAVTFTFAQTDRAVTGNFRLGSVVFPDISATVAADGSLTISSALTGGAFPIEASWVLRRPTATTLTGQTHQVWKVAGLGGEAVLDGEIDSVTKSAAIIASR